jgi:hypothetical protein
MGRLDARRGGILTAQHLQRAEMARSVAFFHHQQVTCDFLIQSSIFLYEFLNGMSDESAVGIRQQLNAPSPPRCNIGQSIVFFGMQCSQSPSFSAFLVLQT